jgi:mono/diheme cytochrome c family protein
VKPSLALVAGAALLLAAAAQAETAGPPPSPVQANGHALFAASCAYCHGARGYATTLLDKRLGAGHGMLETRSDLAPAYIRHAVRHGVGAMPWYRRAELSDLDLDAVVAYLTSAKPAQ